MQLELSDMLSLITAVILGALIGFERAINGKPAGLRTNIVICLENPWAWLGIIPLATGLIGWCPPYALLGISTCSKCNTADSTKGCCSIS